jgi:hypothetical protein
MISGSPGDVKGRVAVYSVESFRLTPHQLLLYSAPHPPAASETRATYTNFTSRQGKCFIRQCPYPQQALALAGHSFPYMGTNSDGLHQVWLGLSSMHGLTLHDGMKYRF